MLTNETLHTLETRRSCRAYLDRQVEDKMLDAVLQAGMYAPTGMGRQSPVIVAVQNKTVRDELSRLNAAVMGNAGDPFYGAPTVLVVLADTACPTWQYDGSLVMGNLLNAAASLGLGSCWIHRAREEFDTPEGRQILAELGVEGDYEGIGHCVLGYAAEVPEPKPRREGRLVWAR